MLTAAEAAERIGCSSRRVRQLLDTGRLDGDQPDGPGTAWAIDTASVTAYLAARET